MCITIEILQLFTGLHNLKNDFRKNFFRDKIIIDLYDGDRYTISFTIKNRKIISVSTTKLKSCFFTKYTEDFGFENGLLRLLFPGRRPKYPDLILL
jgi:hypothetical protein